MPSLVDVAPVTETVDLRGTEIEVVGVGLDTIGQVLEPRELQKAMAGVRFDALGLVAVLPVTIRRLIAASVGKLGDKKTEEAVTKLNADDQLRLIEAMIRVSFPSGVSPFVNRVGAILGIDDLWAQLARIGRAQRYATGEPTREQGSSSSSPSTS